MSQIFVMIKDKPHEILYGTRGAAYIRLPTTTKPVSIRRLSTQIKKENPTIFDTRGEVIHPVLLQVWSLAEKSKHRRQKK